MCQMIHFHCSRCDALIGSVQAGGGEPEVNRSQLCYDCSQELSHQQRIAAVKQALVDLLGACQALQSLDSLSPLLEKWATAPIVAQNGRAVDLRAWTLETLFWIHVRNRRRSSADEVYARVRNLALSESNEDALLTLARLAESEGQLDDLRRVATALSMAPEHAEYAHQLFRHLEFVASKRVQVLEDLATAQRLRGAHGPDRGLDARDGRQEVSEGPRTREE